MANLKSVLKCWTEFNLPALQKSLDQTATETVQRQDESEKAKKYLIELTKEWRKGSDEDVRAKCSPLIKAFQKQIDALNKRSKAAESSFLHLYKNLLEIPDPVPALKQVDVIKKQLEKTKDLELENQQLHDTLAEYNSEFAEVKNQEVTLQKLKEKLKEYEEQGDGKLKKLLEEKEKVLLADYEEKEQKHLDSKLELAAKLGDGESKIENLTKELQGAQVEIFELKSKHEEELIARLSEIEILETDLERSNQNLLASEKQVETLQLQLQSGAPLSHDDVHGEYLLTQRNNDTIKTLEYQLLSKEKETSQLIEEIHNLQNVSTKARVAAENEINSLEKELTEKSGLLATLQSKVVEQADYDELKREISIMKMIEFSGMEEDNDGTSPAKSLEKLLLEKNKNLQSECTTLKVHNVEMTSKYEELQKSWTESSQVVKEQATLIRQLEADLLNVRGLPSSLYRGEGVGAPSTPTDSELMINAVKDIDNEEIDDIEHQNAGSLLPIISSQRERFRTRNLELEAQTAHQQRQIVLLQNEVDSVRHDNVKLYEKIKFLQSYPTQGSTSVQVDDDSVKRYSSQYEERIDPFAVFSQKEKQQRYSNLTAPEKVTLNMGRFILSNKIARTLVFFYTLLLHCLVFIVLYKFAYTEPCKRVLQGDTAVLFANQLPTPPSLLGKSSRQ